MLKSLGILICLFGVRIKVTQRNIIHSLKSCLFLVWTNCKFDLHHQGIVKEKQTFFFLLENKCHCPQMKMRFSRELIIKVFCIILALDSLMQYSCYREVSADVNEQFYCLISQEYDAILKYSLLPLLLLLLFQLQSTVLLSVQLQSQEK